MRDKRFDDGYILIFDFHMSGGVKFKTVEIDGQQVIEKSVDNPDVQARAKQIQNQARHLVASRAAHVPPFGYWASAVNYTRIQDSLDAVRNDAERFNGWVRSLRLDREIRVNLYPANLIGQQAHDRVIMDLAGKFREAQLAITKGDFQAFKAALKSLRNTETMLLAPLNYAIRDAVRELQEQSDLFAEALKKPLTSDQVSPELRETYKKKPASVLSGLLEFPKTTSLIRRLIETCLSVSSGSQGPVKPPSRPT